MDKFRLPRPGMSKMAFWLLTTSGVLPRGRLFYDGVLFGALAGSLALESRESSKGGGHKWL